MRRELKGVLSVTRMVHFRISTDEFQRFQKFANSVGATTSELLREMVEDMNEGAEVCERALLHGDVGSA